MHYILVSGGVISGVGKGIIASSTGLLLQRLGFRVSYIKIDPYVSVDAGLMSPSEHGECYVTASGHECDLDVGSVERYLSLTLTGDNNITTGKIYLNVINRERKGDYLGKTVQIVPHVVNAIKDWIKRVAVVPLDGSGEEPDVCIIELGGTVGDIESMPFVEALTQLRHEVGQKHFANIMVSYVPTIHGEQKTKPTQHAVKSIRSSGLIPDVIACRCRKPLMDETVRKIALHCQAEQRQVIVVRDMPSIYQVPILLEEQEILPILLGQLSLDPSSVPKSRTAQGSQIWDSWKSLALTAHESTVRIALVGKYVKTPDAYMSLVKSLEHAAMHLRRDLDLVWIDAEHLDPAMEKTEPETWNKAWETLKSTSGLIIPGGFGERGVESKMLASKWARENKVPFLGVCLGFQVAVMQYARDHCDMPVANSEEFNANTPEPVVVYMPDLDRKNMGGTMRLGAHKTFFQPGSEWSKLRTLYGGAEVIEERHRHRYEVNPKMIDLLKEKGMEFIGKDETGQRMEIFELKDHPFFVGTQFHAEYQTRVLEPSKPYLGFVAASAGVLDQILEEAKKLPNGKA